MFRWCALSWCALVLSCSDPSNNARLSNNGEDVAEPEKSTTVLITSVIGRCSGTIINDLPQVLTAAHCVVHVGQEAAVQRYEEPGLRPAELRLAGPSPYVKPMPGDDLGPHPQDVPDFESKKLLTKEVLLPSEIRVTVMGREVIPIRVDVKQDYLKSAPLENTIEGTYGQDVAVLTLPKGTVIPGKKALAKSDPVDDDATISGFGKSVPSEEVDSDQDGVPDVQDFCPTTPVGHVATEEDPQRSGCADGETPDPTLVKKLQERPHGVLREGTTQISAVREDGIIECQGENFYYPSAKKVCSAPGDSGGPLLNAKGEVIGIASGGGVEGQNATSYYTNVNDPGVAAFIEQARQNGARETD